MASKALRRFVVATGIALFVSGALQVNAQTLPGWTLTFSDEFDGTSINTAKWHVRNGSDNINNELQVYRPSNVTVQNGYVRFTSRKENSTWNSRTYNYTSGELRTDQNKFNQRYGKFETRTKVPKLAGTWVAQYLLPNPSGWPPEIDIFENVGRDPMVTTMTTHWGTTTSHKSRYSQIESSVAWADAFHTYGVEWEPGILKWFVDGKHVATAVEGQDSVDLPDINMYIRLNTAIGGDLGGTPATTGWPVYQDIDYVRVWRRSNAPPKVNAGADQTITLPTNSVNLAATITDPEAQTTTKSWTKVSGLGTVSFASASSSSTTATFSAAGTYVLRITATDSGSMSASDEITVIVRNSGDIILNPTADAYVRYNVSSSSVGNVNYGTATTIHVKGWNRTYGQKDQYQTYLKFDLATATTITKAVLRVYGGKSYNGETAPLNMGVYPVSSTSWSETGITWNTKPALGSILTTTSITPVLNNTFNNWYEADVTTYLKNEKAAGRNIVCIALVSQNVNNEQSGIFNAREASSNKPYLAITK